MDPIKVDFGKREKKSNSPAIVIPPEKPVLKIILSAVCSVIFAGVLYYFMLPPINFKAYEFYLYIFLVIASFILFLFLFSKAILKPEYGAYVAKKSKIPAIIIGALALVVVVGFLVSCVFFRAKSYSNLLEITEASEEEIGNQLSDGSSLSKVSKLDLESASVIADKKLTDLKDLGKVSQYDVSSVTSQINLNVDKLLNSASVGEDKPVRLFSLKYQNIIKWFYNKKDGLPGYVIVDTSNSKSYFREIKGGIQYSLTDYFSSYVTRHIRFKYPTYMFDTPTFEVDEEGTPWWVCSVIDKRIGVFGGKDVMGVVLVNAQTGDCFEYTLEEVKSGKAADSEGGKPQDISWIDHVYSDEILVNQVNYAGRYWDGFWNSVLNQKGCRETTDGHNYIAYNGDLWLYSGISSMSYMDNSIINFVLINQRTKEAMLYEASGGTESAAQSSAEGLVANYEYMAVFPMLVNINGVPTYFMSLKDDTTDLVKGFAMVSVEDFNDITAFALTNNKTSFVGAYEECKRNYIEVLDSAGKAKKIDAEDDGSAESPDNKEKDTATVSGSVTALKSAVINGNTTYYIKVDNSENYFSVSASLSEEAAIVEIGSAVTLTYSTSQNGNNIIRADSFKLGADAQNVQKTETATEQQ